MGRDDELRAAMAWALERQKVLLEPAGAAGLAILAVGGHVPWQGVLAAYGLTQLAGALPITPGGIGVIEGTLSVLLIAYHMPSATAIAAVLLAVVPVLPGFTHAATTPGGVIAHPDFLDRLYSYGVFLTFSLAGLLYFTFSKLVAPQSASEALPESAASVLR